MVWGFSGFSIRNAQSCSGVRFLEGLFGLLGLLGWLFEGIELSREALSVFFSRLDLEKGSLSTKVFKDWKLDSFFFTVFSKFMNIYHDYWFGTV